MPRFKSTKTLVEEFEKAARAYGWSCDQGSSADAAKDLQTLNEARASLLRRTTYLERKKAELVPGSKAAQKNLKRAVDGLTDVQIRVTEILNGLPSLD